MVTPHHSDQSTASQRKGKPLQFNFNSSGGAFGFFAGSLEGFVTGDGHAHAAFAFDVGFAEEAQLGVGRGEGGVEISETDLDNALGFDSVLHNLDLDKVPHAASEILELINSEIWLPQP